MITITNRKTLQGRVKVPTGGRAREPKGRSGEIPEPTVRVWMGEGDLQYFLCVRKAAEVCEDF